MLLRKLWVHSHLIIIAVLSAGVVAAQSAAPRREPDVPYVPTTETAVQAMLKLGEVKKTDIVYDLGCGDGRIVIAAAKGLGARGVGIDINPVRIGEAKENARKAGVEKLVRFEENDLFEADIHVRYGRLEAGEGGHRTRYRCRCLPESQAVPVDCAVAGENEVGDGMFEAQPANISGKHGGGNGGSRRGSA